MRMGRNWQPVKLQPKPCRANAFPLTNGPKGRQWKSQLKSTKIAKGVLTQETERPRSPIWHKQCPPTTTPSEDPEPRLLQKQE